MRLTEIPSYNERKELCDKYIYNIRMFREINPKQYIDYPIQEQLALSLAVLCEVKDPDKIKLIQQPIFYDKIHNLNTGKMEDSTISVKSIKMGARFDAGHIANAELNICKDLVKEIDESPICYIFELFSMKAVVDQLATSAYDDWAGRYELIYLQRLYLEKRDHPGKLLDDIGL